MINPFSYQKRILILELKLELKLYATIGIVIAAINPDGNKAAVKLWTTVGGISIRWRYSAVQVNPIKIYIPCMYTWYSLLLILSKEIMNQIMSREASVSSAVDVAREVHRRNLVTEETGRNIENNTQSLEDRLEQLINEAEKKKKR